MVGIRLSRKMTFSEKMFHTKVVGYQVIHNIHILKSKNAD